MAPVVEAAQSPSSFLHCNARRRWIAFLGNKIWTRVIISSSETGLERFMLEHIMCQHAPNWSMCRVLALEKGMHAHHWVYM